MQDTPPHLNGNGTDEISDSTDFKEYIFNTKSSVKSRAFLLQAIRASYKKYSKIFRAAAYHPHAKQKILWNFHSSYHHCRRHCHCIAATQIKSYLPPRLLPSLRRHRLTDTSSLHRRYSHRRIATNTPPLLRSSILAVPTVVSDLLQHHAEHNKSGQRPRKCKSR